MKYRLRALTCRRFCYPRHCDDGILGTAAGEFKPGGTG